MPKSTKSATNTPVKDWHAAIHLSREKLAKTLVTAGLRDYERAFLATCQQLFRSDTGCNTPFEEFFRNIVLHVQICGWPTPEVVEEEFHDFQRNFRDMKRDCEAFESAYPSPAAETAQPATKQPTRKPRKKSHAKEAA